MTTVLVSTIEQWRAWLEQHAQSANEAWLVIFHKNSGVPSPRYDEAVEQALCFGWIDGLHRKRDSDSSRLRFTPRSSRSTWSALNRQRAQRMIEQGLMTERGQAVVDHAKEVGTWQVVSDDERDAVPVDLNQMLDRSPAAAANFRGFPPSSKRLILEWIATAKKAETRRRRIERTVELAQVNVRANHPGSRS